MTLLSSTPNPILYCKHISIHRIVPVVVSRHSIWPWEWHMIKYWIQHTKYSRNGRHSRSNINDIWNTFRPQVLVDESGSFHPDYLFATGRFAPLNRYYIDEVFFDNFLVIIYLVVYVGSTVSAISWIFGVYIPETKYTLKSN
jgi:hypothetical protein